MSPRGHKVTQHRETLPTVMINPSDNDTRRKTQSFCQTSPLELVATANPCPKHSASETTHAGRLRTTLCHKRFRMIGFLITISAMHVSAYYFESVGKDGDTTVYPKETQDGIKAYVRSLADREEYHTNEGIYYDKEGGEYEIKLAEVKPCRQTPGEYKYLSDICVDRNRKYTNLKNNAYRSYLEQLAIRCYLIALDKGEPASPFRTDGWCKREIRLMQIPVDVCHDAPAREVRLVSGEPPESEEDISSDCDVKGPYGGEPIGNVTEKIRSGDDRLGQYYYVCDDNVFRFPECVCSRLDEFMDVAHLQRWYVRLDKEDRHMQVRRRHDVDWGWENHYIPGTTIPAMIITTENTGKGGQSIADTMPIFTKRDLDIGQFIEKLMDPADNERMFPLRHREFKKYLVEQLLIQKKLPGTPSNEKVIDFALKNYESFRHRKDLEEARARWLAGRDDPSSTCSSSTGTDEQAELVLD